MQTVTPSNPPVEKLALTRREAAQALSVSTVTLWRLEKTGRIKPIPGVRHKLYSLAQLRAFVEGKVGAA